MLINNQGIKNSINIFQNDILCVQIRDMAFVFEINQNAVKRHMETVANTNQGKNNKYQWSAARPPGSVS